MRAPLLAPLLTLGLALTVACGDKDEDSAATGTTDGTDGADGSDGTADGTDGSDGTESEAPFVESGRVVCVPPASGPEAIVVEVQANDPQGPDTLGASFFGCDGVFDDVGLVCNPTTGACTASIRSEDYGVACADGGSLTWQVNLVDEDGNESGWTTIDWEG